MYDNIKAMKKKIYEEKTQKTSAGRERERFAEELPDYEVAIGTPGNNKRDLRM